MKDKHEHELIETFGQVARQVPIPEGLRAKNRAAIQNAFAAVPKTRRPRWWQQRVAVPLPMAAAVLLLLALQCAWMLRSTISTPKTMDVVAEQLQPPAEDHYTETNVYVAGIGTIERSQLF